MLQFTFNRKLDPDGSKLHKLLEAQITYEQTSAFRSLSFHLLAILTVPVWLEVVILLKNPRNASTWLSMNGKSPMISTAPPFVLRLSKDERKVFQQNQVVRPDLFPSEIRLFIVMLCGALLSLVSWAAISRVSLAPLTDSPSFSEP